MDDYTFLKMEELKRQRAAQASELETIERENYERSARIERYRGQDTDRDSLDDGFEQLISLHDSDNKPNHSLNGIKTRGEAWTDYNHGGVQFPYNNDMVDLRVRPTNGVGKRMKLTMPTPKRMPLSVHIEGKHDHHTHVLGGENIISPHKYRMPVGRAQNSSINAVAASIEASGKRISDRQAVFSKKFGSDHIVKKSATKEHKSVNKLVDNLNDFVRPKSGKLNFKIGSGSPLNKKKTTPKPNKAHDAVNKLVASLSHGVGTEKKKDGSMISNMNNFVSLSLKKKRVLL